MNLVKELLDTARKNHEKEILDAEQVLESVKSSLQTEDAADNNMNKFFGINKEESRQKKTIKYAKQMIAGEFVTNDDVYLVCKKYYLRFLPAKRYKKPIPAKALNELRKYQADMGLSDEQLSKGLMMIAPASHFTLGPRPNNDPVLLYKDAWCYRIITKWGNDFSWLRIAKSFLIRYFMAFVGVILFWMGIRCLYVLIDTDQSLELPTYYPLVASFGLIVGSAMSIIGLAHYKNHQNWDEPYKS